MKTQWLWRAYFVARTRSMCDMTAKDKMKWMKNGAYGYENMLGYDEFAGEIRENT